MRRRLTARQYNSKLHLTARLLNKRNRCRRNVKCIFFFTLLFEPQNNRTEKQAKRFCFISNFLHCLSTLSMKCLNDIAPFFDRIQFAEGCLQPVNSVGDWTSTFRYLASYPPLHLGHLEVAHLAMFYWRLIEHQAHILMKQKSVLD